MPLIDTNAEVGVNGWDVLRFALRFFSEDPRAIL